MEVRTHDAYATELLKYFNKLYQEKLLCDLTIMSKDGTVFQVHRVLVMATSLYLQQLITDKKSIRTINLDFSGEVLYILLEFVYTGLLSVTQEERSNVQNAATHLQMYSVLGLLNQQSEEVTTDIAESTSIHTKLKRKSFLSKDIDDTGIHKDVETTEVNNPGLKPYNKTNQNSSRCAGSFKMEEQKISQVPSRIILGSRSKSINREPQNSSSKVKEKTNDISHHNPDITEVTSRISAPVMKKRRLYQCHKCHRMFQSFLLSQKHGVTVHGAAMCKYLRYRYVLKKLMHKFPRKICDAKVMEGIVQHVCKVCSRKFTRYSLFALHFNMVHVPRTRPYKGWLYYSSTKFELRKISTCTQNKLLCSIRNSDKQGDLSEREMSVPKHNSAKISTCSRMVKSNGANKTNKGSKCKKSFKSLKCSKCGQTFISETKRRAHLRNTHGVQQGNGQQNEQLWECCYCGNTLASSQSLLQHLKSVHGHTAEEAKTLKYTRRMAMACEESTCLYVTNSLTEMADHVTVHHPLIQHGCTFCQRVFKVYLMLKQHVQMTHELNRKKTINCSVCYKSFQRNCHMQCHEYWKHGIQHTNIKIYKCDHLGCEYKTGFKMSMTAHQSKHRSDKPFTCQYCGLKLKTEVCHKKHVDKMHLGIRPYLCQVCGMNFGEEHELKSHMTNKHSTEKSYHCDLCTYATSVKGTFLTHVFNVHKVRAPEDNRTLYKCPYCSFSSILSYRYRNHLNLHTGTRNYICKICGNSFISANTLRSHNQWFHTDAVYSCTQCSYHTKTSPKLNEHIRVQHQLRGLKPFKCLYCSFCCATSGNTRKHIMQVHKGQPVQYLKDKDLLNSARVARASGQHTAIKLSEFLDESNVQLKDNDTKSELAENN